MLHAEPPSVNPTILNPCLVPTDDPVLAIDGTLGGVMLVLTSILPSTII